LGTAAVIGALCISVLLLLIAMPVVYCVLLQLSGGAKNRNEVSAAD
jgi:hypothetical protein